MPKTLSTSLFSRDLLLILISLHLEDYAHNRDFVDNMERTILKNRILNITGL